MIGLRLIGISVLLFLLFYFKKKYASCPSIETGTTTTHHNSNEDIPATSLVASAGVPNASPTPPPKPGVSVVGDWLICIDLHCRQT